MKSTKQKGNKLEYLVRDKFRSFVDPRCERQVMSGGAPGDWMKGDINFSKKIPYNLVIECKNQERFNFWEWWKQSKDQASEFETPVLVFTKNHRDTMVAMKLEDFMKIYEELYDLLEQQESEEEIKCEHKKDIWKIKQIKKLANEYIKNL